MTKRIIGCVLLAAVMGVLIYVCFAGISIGSFVIPPKLGLYSDEGGIRRGLDLDGGALVTFEPIIDGKRRSTDSNKVVRKDDEAGDDDFYYIKKVKAASNTKPVAELYVNETPIQITWFLVE